MSKNTVHNTIGYYSGYVILGMVTAILGPSLPYLANLIGVSIQSVGSVFTARYSGYLIGSLLFGKLYDRLHGNHLFSSMLLSMAVSMAFIPFISDLYILLIAIFVLGLAQGGLDVGGNILLIWTRKNNVAPYMNSLHFFFGFGSTLAPLLVSYTLSKFHNISPAFWLCSLLAIPIIFWVIRIPSPAKNNKAVLANKLTANYSNILLVSIFLFFYIGSEASFAGWIYTYSQSLRLTSEQGSALLNSAFWFSITLGRLLTIPITKQVKLSSLQIVVLAAIIFSLSLMLLLPNSIVALYISVITTGMFMASIFPATITFAKRHMNITGQITGVFLIGSNSGAMIIPWLVGKLFTSKGAEFLPISLIINTLIALGVFLLCTSKIPNQVNTNSMKS